MTHPVIPDTVERAEPSRLRRVTYTLGVAALVVGAIDELSWRLVRFRWRWRRRAAALLLSSTGRIDGNRRSARR